MCVHKFVCLCVVIVRAVGVVVVVCSWCEFVGIWSCGVLLCDVVCWV